MNLKCAIQKGRKLMTRENWRQHSGSKRIAINRSPQRVRPRMLRLEDRTVPAQIYFAQEGTGTISHANVDGSNVVSLVSGLENPIDVEIDELHGKIYWVTTQSQSSLDTI